MPLSERIRTYQNFFVLTDIFGRSGQRPPCDFGNIDTQYNIAPSTASTSLTSTKSPIHIFTNSTSALSLSNKLGLNKRSKHIALRIRDTSSFRTSRLLVLPSLMMFLDSCWFSIMRNHAISCEIMPTQEESCNFGSWYCLDFPTDFGRISQKEERVQLLFVCVAPIPLISVLLLRCATVEIFKLCFQPPQGGHAMKQQAKIHCDHSACEKRQTFFMGLS